MARSPSVSLKTFIYRTLSLRLAAMVLLIGLATAVAIYVVESQNIRNLVVEETRIELQLLVLRSLQIVKEHGGDYRVAFRQALGERLSIHLRRDNGQFVYARFYDEKGKDPEERIDTTYALIEPVKEFIRTHPVSAQETGEGAEIVMLAGNMHVYVMMPIEYLTQRVGFAQGIFVPSRTAQIEMQKKLRRSVALTILIVLLTSVLLYPVILHLMRKLAIFSQDLLEANLETLSILASAIAKRDSDTDVHNFRVTIYAVRLAEELNLPVNEMQSLIKGAFLHDVGKIGVRDNILLKADKLDEDEFCLMKDHVRHGLDIVGSSIWLSDTLHVVGSHHEKFDGSGYPEGIVGEAIPLLARIFAVVDVFDALTSRRPYKEPLSYEESIAILEEGRSRHFDPQILTAFIAISRELYHVYAGRDDQEIRQELTAVITKYFSQGAILLY